MGSPVPLGVKIARDDAKAMCDLIDAGQATLFVIGESRVEEQLDKALTRAEKSTSGRALDAPAPRGPACSSCRFAYRPRREASAIRTSNSFFTSFFGSGLSTAKCNELLVFVYPSVSLASCGSTLPLWGR